MFVYKKEQTNEDLENILNMINESFCDIEAIKNNKTKLIEKLRLGVYRALRNPEDLDDWWWAECKDIPVSFGKFYQSLKIRNIDTRDIVRVGWNINSREKELFDIDQSNETLAKCLKILKPENIF